MPDGMAALRRLGIQVDTRQAAIFEGIRFVDNSFEVEARFPNGLGYGMRRTVLHQRMLERAEAIGVEMHWGARVTGLSADGVAVNGNNVRCRWLVCADGQNSPLRRLAALDRQRIRCQRFGFRRHYTVAPWSQHVEVHWSDCGQMYVTPVGTDEICVAFITRQPRLRFDDALPLFPKLSMRLRDAKALETRPLGSMTVTRQLREVQRGHTALVGEASGSVDAITGEGLSLAFQQATALARAMQTGNLQHYEKVHRRIRRLPSRMAALLLSLDEHRTLRQRVFRAFATEPTLFARMLAVHTGAISFLDFGFLRTLSLGWHLLIT
jgi:2-polyprenyl-6-methoxyphenol hydroxylase-like FAD-dependent oxidoreductase